MGGRDIPGNSSLTLCTVKDCLNIQLHVADFFKFLLPKNFTADAQITIRFLSFDSFIVFTCVFEQFLSTL